MRRILILANILLAAFLIVQAGYSLQWHIAHDEAPLLYEAFLMHSEGFMPYRDIFDFQMPGSYVAYYLLGRLSGFDTFRIRVIDILILATLIIITFNFMRAFGKTSALAAGMLFGLKYLQAGPSMSLQREYLMLIFIALALWIGMRDSLTPKRRLAIGILFGLSAVIKPHASLGLLPFLIFDIIDLVKRQNMTLRKAVSKSILPASVGFAIPVALMILWLAATHALTPFINIALNYWPLYAKVNGQMEINTGAARWAFIFNQLWRLGGHGLWLIPALIGVYLNQNKRTYLLASLALCYAVYPAFSGQFFPYHFIPFIYFIILLASLAITSAQRVSALKFSPIIFLAIAFYNIWPTEAFINQVEGKPIITPTDRSSEIARFLSANLKEGDTVQPLDWTGGALLAMLETRARIATPYVFDFYFYHHISTPYIQSLRMDFIKDLQKSRPRFIVEVTAIDKPWITGEDASRNFPELREFLEKRYFIDIKKSDYTIYERK